MMRRMLNSLVRSKACAKCWVRADIVGLRGVEGSGVQAGDLEAASRLANPGGSKQRRRREANGEGVATRAPHRADRVHPMCPLSRIPTSRSNRFCVPYAEPRGGRKGRFRRGELLLMAARYEPTAS
jgi:hypothetical protein